MIQGQGRSVATFARTWETHTLASVATCQNKIGELLDQLRNHRGGKSEELVHFASRRDDVVVALATGECVER